MPLYPNNYQIPITPNNMWNYASVPTQQTNSNSGFIWVQGEEAAKAYPVAAGNQVLLMDSDKPVLYMKSTDASGRPQPMEIYDLVKRVPAEQTAPSTTDLSQYVRRDEIKELIAGALAEMRPKKQNKPKREDEHDA